MKSIKSPKEDARRNLIKIGKILIELYGINQVESDYRITTAYTNYADICSGINFLIDAYSTPRDAKLGYFNLPLTNIKNFAKDINGQWEGFWKCNNNLIMNVNLSIELKNNTCHGILTYDFKLKSKNYHIKENLSIILFDGYLQILCNKYYIKPSNIKFKYDLDFFELELFDKEILIGEHICKSGRGKAFFKKV